MTNLIVPNWKEILLKSHSVKAMLAAALALSGALDYVPYVQDYLPKKVAFWLIMAGLFGRFIQQNLTTDKKDADDAA